MTYLVCVIPSEAKRLQSTSHRGSFDCKITESQEYVDDTT